MIDNRRGEDEKEVSEAAPVRRSAGMRAMRFMGWLAIGCVVLLLLVAGLTWYSKTADFERRVGKEVVSVLEDSTGGRVELGKISLDLWHLAIEVDGLVIHGLEGPDEAPYLSADKILLHLKINTILLHTLGKGAQSPVGLNYLRVEQPHVHLIITKDGKTNQPVPKRPSTSTTPIQDTLLDLQAKQVELANGLVVVNDRAIPFDLAARDLQAEVHYIAKSDRYGATVDLNDLRTRMAKEPEAQSKLHLEAELGRDAAELKRFDLHTGAASDLHVTAAVRHFAKPEWQTSVEGTVELKQISVLAGVDGLDAGMLDLDIKGHNCYIEPAVAQKQPHFWQRRHPKDAAQPSTKVLPPDPDCQAGYLVVGSVKLHNAGYKDEYVRLHDINGGAQLHVTPTELLFTALTGYLPGGGSAAGELRISNWLGEVPASAPSRSATTVAAAQTANKAAVGVGAKAPVDSVNITPVQRAHAILKVTIDRIPLRTVMDVAGPKGYGDLGFDVAATGPVTAEWGGPATEIADSVNVDGDLRFAPTGATRKGARSNIPVRGQVLAHYRGATETVNIERVNIQTLASTVDASGTLGVNRGDPLTNLRVDAQVRDLGEYDQLLETLGVEANGKKGSAALPVVLHGSLGFDGTAKGAIRALDVKGHLQASDIQVQLGTQADVHIDSVIADAEYSPSALSVADSTIRRGTAVLNIAGAFKPRTQVSRRGAVSYVWDNGASVDATVKLADAQATDVLEIAGQKGKVDLTGVVNVNAHVTGTPKALNGTGQVSLVNGVAYGEPYESVMVKATVQGQQVEASSLSVRLHGMEIAGNGGYNMQTERLHAHLQGSNLQLSKFKLIQQQNTGADGTLSLVADADGTVTEPNLKANLRLANVTLNGQALGELTADAHSEGKTVFYTANSTIIGAQVAAQGQTSLAGSYDTQAKLTLTGLDAAKAMAIFSPDNTTKIQSTINGVVTVSGPIKTPEMLSGTAEFSPLSVKMRGIELKAEGPLRVSLRSGTATLEQVHITGQDTDLQASGTAQSTLR